MFHYMLGVSRRANHNLPIKSHLLAAGLLFFARATVGTAASTTAGWPSRAGRRSLISRLLSILNNFGAHHDPESGQGQRGVLAHGNCRCSPWVSVNLRPGRGGGSGAVLANGLLGFPRATVGTTASTRRLARLG